MNKTIQSNSYRAYSKSLLDRGISDLDAKSASSINFLERNLNNCLKEFRDWVPNQVAKANELASQELENLAGKQKKNFQIWLDEKISKMLDVYWAPLSQAATQYASPAYKEYLDNLIQHQDLRGRIEGFLVKLNQLVGLSGTHAITSNDIVVFFDELTLIRRHPYTTKALISVPFRAIETSSPIDEKLSGVAHEIGHVLYWRQASSDPINGKQRNLRDEIVDALIHAPYNYHPEGPEIRFVKSWIEELFADFVGAKIAGDVYVKSSENMVIRGNKSSLTLGDNDQDHVPDILRPLVGIYTVNCDRAKALHEWRTFYAQEYPVDMSTIKITAFRESKYQRNINRSPEQLTEILLDTIDVLSRKIIDEDGHSLLQPNTTAIPNSSELLAQKASLIAQQSNGELTVLDAFLEPVVLEEGAQTHYHNFTVTAHTKTTWYLSHYH